MPIIRHRNCLLDGQRISGFESGTDSHISKPFSSQLLTACIRNLPDNREHLKQMLQKHCRENPNKLIKRKK